MAEGILSEILGSEDERNELEASGALGTSEAFAAAVAAKLAGGDPGVARKTEEFLSDQSQLLKLQAEHLRAEHAARLHYLEGQAREVDIRRFGLRLRVAFQLFVALVATVLGIGFIVMVHDAVTSRTVVIDPVDISPNIATQVPSGKIVAAGLLDVLTRIQSATHSNAESRQLSNAWTNDIAIEVPETGISFGQLDRLLKARFGHDQHIDGDLVRPQSGGLAFTVRGSGILPKTFVLPTDDIDALLTQAAEYVYAQAEPGLWAVYLTRQGRDVEMIAFAKHAYRTMDAAERPVVLNAWANALANSGTMDSMREALDLYRETVRLKPDYWAGYNNIMFALSALGHEEEVVRVGEQLKKLAGGRPGRAAEKYYGNYDQVVWEPALARASSLADLESNDGVGTTSNNGNAGNLGVARFDLQLHDPTAAGIRIKTTGVDAKNPIEAATLAIATGLLAEENRDLKSAVEQFDTYLALFKLSSAVSQGNPQDICLTAVAYQNAGQGAKADAALDAVGNLHFVDCERFRGDVLELRGDWQAAQDWYAKAVELAPSVPSSYYSWGVALAKHGDLADAADKLELANKKGPHWADPLKAWGDVLAKQGKPREAARKYDQALQYAPNWKELKEARAALAT